MSRNYIRGQQTSCAGVVPIISNCVPNTTSSRATLTTLLPSQFVPHKSGDIRARYARYTLKFIIVQVLCLLLRNPTFSCCCHPFSRLPVLQARRPRDPILAPVIQVGPSGEDVVDLNSYLMRNRIIFLGQRINDQVAVQTVASLLALNSLDDKSDIKLYINCAAGSSYSVVSILDTMNAITAPISTVGFGMVGGTAVQILSAGTKGKRFSMPNTRIMLQQPNGGAMGSADEVNIQAAELNRTMQMMNMFLSESTGLSVEVIEEECDRENFLSPEQAMELGIIDGIISSSG